VGKYKWSTFFEMVQDFCPTTLRKWAGYFWHKQPHEKQDDPNWKLFLDHEATVSLTCFVAAKLQT
jgi:hypothetical protein